MHRRLAAELLGTYVLVLGGCGSAVLAAGAPGVGIGWLGVSLAFGLSVLVMAFAVGHISGGHFNPAVTVGLIVGRRFDPKDGGAYVISQVVGACLAAGTLFIIASGVDGFDAQASGFAANGYDDLSPGGYSMLAGLVAEVVLTAVFLLVIMGSTDEKVPKGSAPFAIGLTFTLIHLVSIPVTNTSVNPARSTGPAIFAGADAIGQLWLFWLAPLVGAAIGASIYRYVLAPERSTG